MPSATKRQTASPAKPVPCAAPERACSSNAFQLLEKAGPSITLQSLHDSPQAVSIITAAAPTLSDLPDDILATILRLVAAPLRARAAGTAAVRQWLAYASVCRRWRQHLEAEPLWLCVNDCRWVRVLEWANATPIRICGLELHVESAKDRQEATAQLLALLGSSSFQGHSGTSLRDITTNLPLPIGRMDWRTAWPALRYISNITVSSSDDVSRLRLLPPRLHSLKLTGAGRSGGLPALGNALQHLRHLKVLTLNSLHLTPHLLPQVQQRLSLWYCTMEAPQDEFRGHVWPAGLSERWAGPYSAEGIRSMMFMMEERRSEMETNKWYQHYAAAGGALW